MTDQGSKQHEKNGKDEPDEWLFADLDMDGVTGWIVRTNKSSKDIEKLSATFTLDLNYDEQDTDGNHSFGFDAVRLFGTADASVEGVADTFPGLSTFCVHLHFALDNLDEVPKAPSEQSVDTAARRGGHTGVGPLRGKPEKDLYNGNKIKKTDLATLLLANLGVPVFVGTLAAVGSATGGSSVFID
ncbi:hypothetical protein LTS10_011141 [Elasticomyces elasticus]|nr:hypothetical protein LTS10_011141 [Elasticomyces elasticus]